MKSLLIGINYPWIDYGWDFGDPPLTWIGGQSLEKWRAHKREQIVRDFREFARLGISAIRWFLLADGLNYGMGADAPETDGSEWHFQPLAKRHAFHQQLGDDFEFVLQTCAELKLQLLPSLIDFHFCFPGHVADENTGVVKCGRSDILNDAAKRRIFLDNVLEPLLDVSQKYSQTIYAWEPFNEPEWCTQKKGFTLFSRSKDLNRTVSLEKMREFIIDAVARVNHRKIFASTIGFAHWETIAAWEMADCGITLQQFHYYAQDNEQMPSSNADWNAPCIVGEFATAVERPWPELVASGTTQAIPERLRWVAEKGYAGAFLWSARGTDQATLWTSSEERELLAFTQQRTDEGIA
jgi:hypothetical protein